MPNVLWVEDDTGQYRWVYEECAALGIEIHRSRSLAEAELELLRAPEGGFALVIVDNIVPDGRDSCLQGGRPDDEPGAAFVLDLLRRPEPPRKVLLLTFFVPESEVYKRLVEVGGDRFDLVNKSDLSLSGIVEFIREKVASAGAENGGGE